MNINVLSVGAPTFNKYRSEWVAPVKFGLQGGSLDFKKVTISVPGWAGSVSYQAVLVSAGGMFYLTFRSASLPAFSGSYMVNFRVEGAPTLNAEVTFLSYIKPFYASKWDAGVRPTLKVGDCSCVNIEVVGMKPGAEYRLENVLRKTKSVITSMSFTANQDGLYQTRSEAEIPDNFATGAYDVLFFGPGLPEQGKVVDYFEIEARLVPTIPVEPPTVEPPTVEPPTVEPPTEKCPPDRPSEPCLTGTHLEPVYPSGLVMPGSCRIAGWECVDNAPGNGPGDGTPRPPDPSCSILWAVPFDGKIATRKQGDVTDVKVTVINLQPGAEYRLQNVRGDGGVISEMKVSADESGVMVFEDHESLIPFDWPLGSYSIRLLGIGVSLKCGGFKLMEGTPICEPGMTLAPGGQCLPIQADRKLWMFLAVMAVIFIVSRR